MKSKTHASISGSAGSSTQAIISFFVNPQGVSSRSSDTIGSTLPSTSHTSLDTAVVTGDVIRAEVLWTLKVVMCHYSFNNCNYILATFRAMFPDSGIAKTFTCGATKCAYLTCFGLAPYFHEQLVGMVRSTACYSISFDECMNRISQNEKIVKLTESTVFPLKFCPHRWVEDVVVAERDHQMWPNIKKYVSSFRATPKKAPQTASYATIKEACEDPLTVTKLEFFISVAKQLQPFCSSSRQMPQWLPSWDSH